MSTAPTLPPCGHQPRAYSGPSRAEVLDKRKRFLNPAIFHFYKEPVMVVEGSMQYVWDETGRRYLDTIGGIVTISCGHCHPHVTRAMREQLDTLQHATTAYLHPNIAEFAEALAGKMPGDLKVCYFVNSGSEANDLAILMARLHTGNYDVIALRNAYHGGSASTMGLTAHSTWKYNVAHSFGVHHTVLPDCYRGPYGYDDPQAGAKYAEDVASTIAFATSGRVAGFFAESIQGVGGAVTFPDGYLRESYRMVREAGGVCIADEVQTGFGRTGTHYWGFENHGVIPDIVTMAKGIGNGAPLAAVVTTPEVAQSMLGRVHFNTFGGNPISSAAGKAVLEVIEREGLQQRCHELGGYLFERLHALADRHDIIGDVRGRGLMVGVELVQDRGTKAHASAETLQVFERAKDLGLLMGKGGLRGNVLRIKPPMCLTREDIDFVADVLDTALSEV